MFESIKLSNELRVRYPIVNHQRQITQTFLDEGNVSDPTDPCIYKYIYTYIEQWKPNSI